MSAIRGSNFVSQDKEPDSPQGLIESRVIKAAGHGAI